MHTARGLANGEAAARYRLKNSHTLTGTAPPVPAGPEAGRRPPGSLPSAQAGPPARCRYQ